MYIENKKGQSTVEYILLVTAVISVAILFTVNSGNPFRSRLNSVYVTATNDMNTSVDALQRGHAATGNKDASFNSAVNVTVWP